MVERLTPPKDIIVYTFRGVDGPHKITVEWFASKPPRESHSEHKAENNYTEGVDEVSEAFEMCRY